MAHPVDRHTVGLVGAVGALLIAAWAVGFLAFGQHRWPWHALFPIGVVLVLVQVVRRMNAADDD